MAKLNRSDDTTNKGPGRIDINQGDFREQQDVVGDSLLQLGGRGEVEPGAGQVNDPLNAPFVLYVNPYTGKDDVVLGSYATEDDGSFDQEIRRIESQRLVCGYTEAAPFKSISRAVIEAGLITSKNYFTNVPVPKQLVTIMLAPGEHIVDNAAGLDDSDTNFPAYSNDTIDAAWLQSFNPADDGGLILPRGCSVVSLDLRKTVIRPGTVPAPDDETAYNRRTIFRVTGEGYYSGLTFKDKTDATSSHHLLSCFEFTSKAQIDEFYSKLEKKFGDVTGSNIDDGQPVARTTEWQIVGPQPTNPTPAVATVASAS